MRFQLDELPSKFVVKANQWSGGNFICTNKDGFNSEVKDTVESIHEWNLRI